LWYAYEEKDKLRFVFILMRGKLGIRRMIQGVGEEAAYISLIKSPVCLCTSETTIK
jgi:hypothetical protein